MTSSRTCDMTHSYTCEMTDSYTCDVIHHTWARHTSYMSSCGARIALAPSSSLYMNESCHTCESIMPHIWIRHCTHMNVSCHTYEWVLSHTWMSHLTHTNESCHIYEWDMSSSRDVKNRGGAFQLYIHEWVSSHVWMNHVTRMNESRHTNEWVMSHNCSANSTAALSSSTAPTDSFICAAWFIHMCDMAHSHVGHDPWICATCLIHNCDMAHSYVQHDSLTCTTWLIHISHVQLKRKNRSGAFQLYGYDFILDSQFRVWLLEVCLMRDIGLFCDRYTL